MGTPPFVLVVWLGQVHEGVTGWRAAPSGTGGFACLWKQLIFTVTPVDFCVYTTACHQLPFVNPLSGGPLT